jgi:hypothetical protein
VELAIFNLAQSAPLGPDTEESKDTEEARAPKEALMMAINRPVAICTAPRAAFMRTAGN